MDERTRRTVGLLLFVTVQVVSLAVLEHQQQMEGSHHNFVGSAPSFSNHMVIPVLGLWESMHTTAILAYLKRRSNSSSSEDEDNERESAEDASEGNSRNKRKRDFGGDDGLASVLLTSSQAMQTALAKHIHGHIEAHGQNSEIDRIQRKDESNKLVSVLGELAHAMGIIAEKL